jgi:putative addiction module component (TIGR02574 family)
MTTQTQAIFQAALTLSEEERVFLVERLLETIPPDRGQFSDDELFAELERRRAEVQAGTAGGIPWSELRQER